MGVKIFLVRSIEFVTTSSDDKIDLRKSKQIVRQLVDNQSSLSDCNILIDFRRTHFRLDTVDILEFTIEISKIKLGPKSKIALLVFPGLDFDTGKFIELCSKNRELKMEVHTNYEDAIQWFYES